MSLKTLTMLALRIQVRAERCARAENGDASCKFLEWVVRCSTS